MMYCVTTAPSAAAGTTRPHTSPLNATNASPAGHVAAQNNEWHRFGSSRFRQVSKAVIYNDVTQKTYNRQVTEIALASQLRSRPTYVKIYLLNS